MSKDGIRFNLKIPKRNSPLVFSGESQQPHQLNLPFLRDMEYKGFATKDIFVLSTQLKKSYEEYRRYRENMGVEPDIVAFSFAPQTEVVYTTNHPKDKCITIQDNQKGEIQIPLYYALCALFSEITNEYIEQYVKQQINFETLLNELAVMKTFNHFIRKNYQENSENYQENSENQASPHLSPHEYITVRTNPIETQLSNSTAYKQLEQMVEENLINPDRVASSSEQNLVLGKWKSIEIKTEEFGGKDVDIYVTRTKADGTVDKARISHINKPPFLILGIQTVMNHGPDLSQGKAFIEEAFNDCLIKELSFEELTKRIAVLNYLMQNISPFSRGTPTLTQVLLTALYSYHHYDCVKIKEDICFHALSSTLEQHIEKFAEVVEVKPKPKPKQAVSLEEQKDPENRLHTKK